MNKALVFERLVAELQRELDAARRASLDAAEYATNEEARAESQWDTQGLEASYLAAGQAGQARMWAAALEDLVGCRADVLDPDDEVQCGAFVQCQLDGEDCAFFILPVAGGVEFEVDGVQITVVSIKSPVAAAMRGRRKGASFQLANGITGYIQNVE